LRTQQWCVLCVSLFVACTDSNEPPTTVGVGGECALGCAAGLACLDDARFAGGYCTARCDEAACPEDASCVTDYGASLCLASCDDDSGCRDGYHCFRRVCRPPCTSIPECGGAGTACVDARCTGAECAIDGDCRGLGRCLGQRCVTVTGDGGMGLDPGAPCSNGLECRSAICLPPDLGGVCATACSDRTTCGAEQVCTPIASDADGDSAPDYVLGACVAPSSGGAFLAETCASHAECESRACVDGRCTESCDDPTDCLRGQECATRLFPGTDVPFQSCGFHTRIGDTEVLDLDLGTVVLSGLAPSPNVFFVLPDDAVSFVIHARRIDGPSVPLAFIEVSGPAEPPYFSYFDFASWVDQPVRWYPSETFEHIQMMVPNSTPDRVVAVGGRHNLSFIAQEETGGMVTLALSAVVKRAAGPAPTGVLDLNLHFVGVDVNAAEAMTDPRVQGAIQGVRDIYAPAGITLGTIRYFDLSDPGGTLSVLDSTDGPTSELSQLLALGADRTEDGVDVFFVRGIADDRSGGITLGIAGGIPGPANVHGTIHSGVAVSFDARIVGSGTDGARNIAQIMAHEMGHYVGLFHNRERLSACPAGTGPDETRRCSPFGGEDVIADTSRSDGTNLMWYALGGEDGRTYNVALSNGQGFVMRASPLVHP
jgi:hypothetical protein